MLYNLLEHKVIRRHFGWRQTNLFSFFSSTLQTDREKDATAQRPSLPCPAAVTKQHIKNKYIRPAVSNLIRELFRRAPMWSRPYGWSRRGWWSLRRRCKAAGIRQQWLMPLPHQGTWTTGAPPRLSDPRAAAAVLSIPGGCKVTSSSLTDSKDRRWWKMSQKVKVPFFLRRWKPPLRLPCRTRRYAPVHMTHTLRRVWAQPGELWNDETPIFMMFFYFF